ncbi:MAG: zinc metalloprotease HtpX, partial [Acidimicrobiia bacterium]|nr:zinc metalloprotease HtpX [Acidimicrobiia bacterium]
MDMYQQIARNKRRTFILLFAFVVLMAAVATALGVLLSGGGSVFGITALAIIIAIAMAWGSYFFSDKVALASSHAKLADGQEYLRYHNLVEG